MQTQVQAQMRSHFERKRKDGKKRKHSGSLSQDGERYHLHLRYPGSLVWNAQAQMKAEENEKIPFLALTLALARFAFALQ